MLELLRKRRSIRKYQEKPVEKEKIDEILRAALLVPSSRSRRPWEFIAVTDKELLDKLSQSREFGSQFLKGSPLVIVIIADKELCDVWIEDSTIAAITMHYAAHAMGLGSCWIQVRERMHDASVKTEEYIKNVLNIPERFAVECIISIGYPAEEKAPYEDKDLLYNKLHFNGYEQK